MKKTIERFTQEIKEFAISHKRFWPHAGGIAAVLLILLVMGSKETVHVYHRDVDSDFSGGRLFGTNEKTMYEGKEALYGKTIKELEANQAALKETTEKLQKELEEMNAKKEADLAQAQGASPATSPVHADDPIRVHENGPISETNGNATSLPPPVGKGPSGSRSPGKSVISFPVKELPKQENAVTLPSGSYVKAKLMTGVAAPEGKTYPVLLQLDYAYILPNKNKLDLAGCFMIAKSQGDLSTERVQMQATKLSCVSKLGKMFEKDVNGFVADDKDNSFAVSGIVNSKQDRVATMAFLSSIVEGVGKAIQQAQTTQQTNALGGSQSVVTGDQASYMAAGGASQAASLVTQWYLKQAQNLLPTINVGSGQDVWIVMQDSVKLPNSYFVRAAAKEDGGVFSYFSRLGQ